MVPPNIEDPVAQKKSDPRFTVLMWDHQRARLDLVSRIITRCGAQPRYVENLATIRDVEITSGCNVAVIALRGCPAPGDLCLDVVRSLKKKGYKTIAYAEDARSWPIGVRCLVLLAGSMKLLDCASSGFEEELRGLLSQLLQTEARRREEEQSIKDVMRRLGIVGESQAMITVFRQVLRISLLSDLPVLITGETGTGKELLARAIHQLDPKRGRGPFIAVNCGAISPTLAESEFFGHRRGAFTGAERHHTGLIRAAHGGILFLDEIGDLDAALQVKLLRVLQDKRVLGVGEVLETAVDVRIIAASNKDIGQMLQLNKFREDLFHRLNVLSIHIAPLRERLSDIPPLIEHLTKKYRSLRSGDSLSVGSDFNEALTRVELPGNVRQLENIVWQSSVNKEDSTPLNISDLPLEVLQQLSEQRDSLAQSGKASDVEVETSTPEALYHQYSSYLANMLNVQGWNLKQSMQVCERILLDVALRLSNGNQSQAARLLGITPRSIYNKIRKHHLSF